MGSDAILDFARLQAASPPAEDPSADSSPNSPYWNVYNIRELAVQMDRAEDRDGEPDRTSLPQWRKVQEAVCRALEAGSWHFKILGWLIDSLVRNHGYAGLRDGFRLSRELIEQHWAELYPAIADGIVDRVAPLAGLNGEDREGPLPGLVRRIPLIPDNAGSFSLLHYIKARDIESITDPETRARMESQPGAVTMQQIVQAASQTPRDFVDALVADLDECEQEFESLWRLLEEHCSAESPGFPPSSHIRSVFTEARDALGHVFPYLRAQTQGSVATGDNGGGSFGVKLAGREEAFQQMLEVASFFRRTEPHSPVPYLLDLAVRWGRTPLHSLLMETSTHELLSKLVEAQQPPTTEQN